MADYAVLLKSDLLEQFKDKPVISALMDAIGEQLTDVYNFFEALKLERTIERAVGKQLDGIGDIVVLTRKEAGELACIKESVFVLEDEEYRNYLIFKIWRNSNNCTYYDILKAIRMFWPKPLYYSEDPEIPATMILETDTLTPEDHVENLLRAPIIKAAGVGLRLTAITESPEVQGGFYIGVVMGQGIISTILPTLEPAYEFDTEMLTGAKIVDTRMETPLQPIGVAFAMSQHVGVAVSSMTVSHKLREIKEEE